MQTFSESPLKTPAKRPAPQWISMFCGRKQIEMPALKPKVPESAMRKYELQRLSAVFLLLFFGNIQPRFRALQSVFGARVIDLGIVALQPLFGAVFGFLRALYVDLLRTLGGFG